MPDFPPITIPPAISREVLVEGTLIADGTEQTVFEHTADKIKIIHGWIDLNSMDFGDTVVIRSYVDFGGGYRIHATENYSDAQSKPAVFFVGRMLKNGHKYKVTLEQTGGTLRSFPYVFFEEVIG